MMEVREYQEDRVRPDEHREDDVGELVDGLDHAQSLLSNLNARAAACPSAGLTG
jgi:hypothetical protein